MLVREDGRVRVMMKNALMFAGAGLLLVLAAPNVLPMLEGGGFAPQAPTPQARLPVAVAPAPTQASVSSSFRELNVPADGRGQYYVDALIDGVRVPFIVDTGASFVSISADVAQRLGLVETADSPHYVFQTANGSTTSYGVTLKNIDLGSIYVDNVAAAVNPNMGGINLLGANFLKRLASVEQRDGRLILRQ